MTNPVKLTFWIYKAYFLLLLHSYLQTIKQEVCSFYSLLKWNCSERTNHKQETHLFKQLPGAAMKRSKRLTYLKTLHLLLDCICLVVPGSHALPLTLSRVSGGRFSPGWWTVGLRGGSGGSVYAPCSLKSGRQLLAALCRFASAKLLHALQLPADSVLSTASFYVIAWCVSQHRMSAAFHKMGLCQLSYDHSPQGGIQECL